jgi:hypothetical protein
MKKITNTLRNNLTLNLARIKTASLMIIALLDCRSVQLSKIARHFAGKAKIDSSFRRLQRFLAELSLPQADIARLNLEIIQLDKPFTLIFDRTNWKFGSQHINILFLCVAFNGLAIPLFFKFLRGKKQGNSSYIDRIELMERFLETFGRAKIKVILGDREFSGKRWILWLRRKKLPFVMRLSEKLTHISADGENFSLASKAFLGLKTGLSKSLGYCFIGKTDSFKACVSAKRTIKNNLVVLAHSDDIKDPAAYYKMRWEIESMFRTLKTGGFNLESTHITKPDRIENLVAIVSIAFCFAYRAGIIAIKMLAPKIKKHGYLHKSIIRAGLDLIFEAFFVPIKWRKKPHIRYLKPHLLKIFVM